jgi:ribosome-associated protein
MATKKKLTVKAGKTPAKKTTAAKKTVKKKAAPKKAAATKKTTAKKAAKAPKTGREKLVRAKNDAAFLLASTVVEGILDKKGENIVCLDLRKIENAICDYFIICEANSNIQVEAIADSVEDTVKKKMGQRPYRSEGWENALWVLIDYVDVVVHVFERDTRQFYNLESLWADAEEVKF